MTERELIKECKNRGFIQRKKSYMRVIGDGVFQHILFGFKERLDPSAPGYSRTHRFEPRILIYLKSLYAQYEGRCVSIDSTIGHRFAPPEFIDKQSACFMGAEPELERMLNEGLDILDGITSQQHIIEHLEPITVKESVRYSAELYDVYLYCEEFFKARMAIETTFSHNYFAITGNYKRDPNRFSERMRTFLADESYYERYTLTAPVNYDAAKNRLKQNYEVNSRRLREIGII